MPFFSIIMPAYNAQKYLRFAINSCLTQSFKNFELLIIDDLSTDRTRNIINEFVNQDPRVKLLSGTHQGIMAVRKQGFEAASGTYLLSLDADDAFINDQALEIIAAAILEHPEAEIISYYYRKMTRFGHLYQPSLKIKENIYSSSHNAEFFTHLIHNGCLADVWRNAIKRELFLKTKLTYGNYIYFSETIIMLQLYQNSNAVYLLKDELVRYRILSNSLSRTRNLIDIVALEKTLDLITERDFLQSDTAYRLGLSIYESHIIKMIEGFTVNPKLNMKDVFKAVTTSKVYQKYHLAAISDYEKNPHRYDFYVDKYFRNQEFKKLRCIVKSHRRKIDFRYQLKTILIALKLVKH
ncbi:MAG: glycosyltransferase [Erysipelotrichaceae bacterium]|jgi:glycosyltransferase involved in cell wall biosynthesis|nr:glycosyltransferase [Erysipelotrichaceae bacterium]